MSKIFFDANILLDILIPNRPNHLSRSTSPEAVQELEIYQSLELGLQSKSPMKWDILYGTKVPTPKKLKFLHTLS